MADSSIKHLVIVGDAACGKTTLLKTICAFSDNNKRDIPDVFENFPIKVTIDGRVVDLALWDAENAEHGKQFGPRACAESDVAVVCFSVDRPESLESLRTEWIPSIQNLNYHTRIIIVGCKTDLRKSNQSNNNVPFVEYKDGAEVASACGNLEFAECSSLMKEGVHQLLQTITRAIMKEEKVRSRCVIC